MTPQPQTIWPGPVVYETHMHTPLCRHADGEIEEYAAYAERRGLRGIIVTCHNPLPDGYSQDVRMYPDQLPLYLSLVDRARQAWLGRIDVRLGLECDWVAGQEDFLARQIASANFDYILGSVHPHVWEYRQRFEHNGPVDFQRTYFEHLAVAAETRLFDCLSHPDIVKNLHPDQWNLKQVLDSVRRSLDRIAATGMAMELNTSGLGKEIPEMNPGRTILREMKLRDIPVVVGADAHRPDSVADHYEAAYDMLKDAGYQQVTVVLNRRPTQIPLDQARRSLRPIELAA